MYFLKHQNFCLFLVVCLALNVIAQHLQQWFVKRFCNNAYWVEAVSKVVQIIFAFKSESESRFLMET